MRPCAVAAMFISIAMASKVSAQQLWHNTSIGMTVAQLKSEFPTVRLTDTITSSSGRPGQYWSLDRQLIEQHSANVEFYFEDEHLKFVKIKVGGADNMQELNSLSAQSYVAALAAQYGPPMDCNPSIHGDVTGKSCAWVHGGTEIDIQEVGNDATGLVTITYSAAKKGEL